MAGLPWYAHSIQDYERKTAHLTMLEHGAYRLMMDHYYKTAAPLPANAEHVHRICRAIAEQEKAACDAILQQFFCLRADGWHNERADEELSRMAAISGKRRNAAKSKHKPEPVAPSKCSANAEQMQTHLHEHIQEQEVVSSLRSDTCGTASPAPPVIGPEFIRLPTNRFEANGEEVPIYSAFVEEMQALYPGVEVREQLRSMRAWLVTNDRQRKTKSGMKRFINSWLSREQNKSPRETIRGRSNGKPSANDKFLAASRSIIDEFLEEAGGGDNSGAANEIGRPLLSA